MSESFSDLWASSNPVKSQQPQQRTLGVAAKAPTNALRATPDAFNVLASAGSRPNSRPITPSNKQKPFTSKSVTATSDAFGGLVSFSSSTSQDDGLTIAERAAKAELERKERIEKDKVAFNVQGSFWDKYEGQTIGEPTIPDAHVKSNGLWELDFLTPVEQSSEQSHASKSSESSDNIDTRGLDLIGSIGSKPPVNVMTPATVPTVDIFDLDHLDTFGTLPISHVTESPRTRPSGSFDFGDQEDQLLGAINSQDEDDILGPLAKPVEAVKGIVSKVPSPPLIPSPSTLLLNEYTSIEASSSVLTTSGIHKAAATEHFELGRFAEAEAAYTRAIDVLPASHLLCIPLYNNRALTRLRTGGYKGTIDDTTEVLRIITGDVDTAWHPGREEAGPRAGFGDAVSKALLRRAEAYEGLEKWKDAVGDWEWLSAAAWVNPALKGDAVKGSSRCRQMARGGSSLTMPPKLPLKQKPNSQAVSTPPRKSPTSSEALTRIRAANTALEKEDQARYDLKDIVDTRLATWRNGKENNIRALIASLDLVLSPTFRWQTVGMSELVSPGQVKAKYTKAIAKLHPDKLNVNSTTLEERMLANSVFGTLNEAWNAFRKH